MDEVIGTHRPWKRSRSAGADLTATSPATSAKTTATRSSCAGSNTSASTTTGRSDLHAQALEEVTVSWRGSYGYLTGYLSEDDSDTIKLCRIEYLGLDDDWAFAIWQASTDSYTDAVLLAGQPAGHPSQALDTACTLYLASTSEPLKD